MVDVAATPVRSVIAAATATDRLSVAAALLTFFLKLLSWKVTGSVSLLSDALESLVNVATAVAALVAIRVADSNEFNHGMGLDVERWLGEGLVDIGNSGRKPTPEEIDRYGLSMFKWAIDGVGAVVNPKNAVRSLTKEQLKAVYAGKVDNWAALGGADHAITLYTRDEASGTRDVFWKKALEKGDIHSRALFIPSNGAMKTAVANDPYAIGYVSVGHMDASVAPVAIDGVVPTIETVKSDQYRISRGLYSNTRGEPTGLTRLFIDYLFTPEGQQIAAAKGFIPVK